MPKAIRTECGVCGPQTNHLVLYSRRVKDIDEDSDVRNVMILDYLTVQCRGCDEVSFVLRYSGSFFGDEKEYFDSHFPDDLVHADYPLLYEEEISQLPSTLRQLYREIIVSLQADTQILVGVGLRMLVEAICMEQNVNGRNLKIKIEKLHDAGLIAKSAIPILDKLRAIGNSSAHEIRAFSQNQITYALEIVNHILKGLYILPKIDKKLKVHRIEPRNKKMD